MLQIQIPKENITLLLEHRKCVVVESLEEFTIMYLTAILSLPFHFGLLFFSKCSQRIAFCVVLLLFAYEINAN